MVRDNEKTVWASVLAALSVAAMVGVLYVPLFVQ
jgi:hypothetical protein